jgi:hypothetical protein
VSDPLSLLREFHAAKLAMLLRHEAGARLVAQYDANNTYQYIIAREDVQLSWLAAAIADLGGVLEPALQPQPRSAARGEDGWQEIAREDARDAGAFVDAWRPRVEAMTHARHRGMLRVILGETLEQKRFFEQAAAGQLDLLGRRPDHVGQRVGKVLPTRWIE